MNRFIFHFMFVIFFSTSVFAQLQIVSTSPLNGSYNVGVGQTISVTFNEPLDTTMSFNEQEFIINSIQLNGEVTFAFSPDHKTITFMVRTVADKDYSFCFYGLRSESGDTLAVPYIYRFTTEPTFSGVSLSGKITSCDTTVNLGNSMIVLLNGEIEADTTEPILVTLANADGSFVLPYVKNGTYSAVAINDLRNPGSLGPGDLFALVDSITVQGSVVDSIDFYFPCPVHYTFSEIAAKVDSFAQTVIPDFGNYTLIDVNSWDVASDGTVSGYDFYYRNNAFFSMWYDISFDNILNTSIDYEFGDFSDRFMGTTVPVGNLVFSAVSPDSFLAEAEQNGGAFFRQLIIPNGFELDVHLELGQLSSRGYYDIAPDPNGIYWGVEYRIHEEDNWDNTLALFRVIADYQTGNILVIDDVNDAGKEIPEKFELSQNYPNPFNPTTKINYSIPVRGAGFASVTNVKLIVYDALGRKVATLVNKQQAPGNYSVQFDASNLPSGIYFYRLQSANFTQTRKMVLMK